MNDTKSKTYLHPGTSTYSSLDLSLCSPAILPDFEWKVRDDLHGSDHFPIFISSTQPSSCERSKKWKLSKANWERFQVLCEQTITRDKFQDCEDPAKLFTSLLIDAAKQSVPQTSTKPKQEGHDGPVSLHWLIREIHSYQTLHYLGIGLKHKTPYKD